MPRLNWLSDQRDRVTDFCTKAWDDTENIDVLSSIIAES